MRITFNKSELRRCVERAAAMAKLSGQFAPIAGCIGIYQGPEGMVELRVAGRYGYTEMVSALVTDPSDGVALVAAPLAKLLPGIKSTDVSIEIDGTKATLEFDNAQYELEAFPISEMFELPVQDIEVSNQVEANSGALSNAIYKAVNFTHEVLGLRPAMECVCLRPTSLGSQVIATDSHQLYMDVVRTEMIGHHDILLPSAFVRALQKLKVIIERVTMHDTCIIVESADGAQYIGERVVERFVDASRVIDNAMTDIQFSTEIDAAEILQVLKRLDAGVPNKGSASDVVFGIDAKDGKLTLEKADVTIGKHGREVVRANLNGECRVALSNKYFANALSVLSTPKLQKRESYNSPLVMTEGGQTLMLMPVLHATYSGGQAA